MATAKVEVAPRPTDQEIMDSLKRNVVDVQVDPAVARNLQYAGTLADANAFIDALVAYEHQEGDTFLVFIDDPDAVKASVSSRIKGEYYPSVARQCRVEGTTSTIQFWTRSLQLQLQNVGLSSLAVQPTDHNLVFTRAW